MPISRSLGLAAAVAILFSPCAAWSAAPPAVKVEAVVTGLSSPLGLALRPGTNELYISDSGGGQVSRVLTDQPAKMTPVITGFPTREFPGAKFQVGPLGLTFLDRLRLAVGGGGARDGHDVVYIFNPPVADTPFKLSEAKQTLGPLAPRNGRGHSLGFFHGLAATPYALFVTTRGDSSAGWIARAISPEGANTADLQLAIDTKSLSGMGGPTALTVSKRGELVVAEVGDYDKPADARLAFYDPKPKQGRLLLSVGTGLREISALAYGPTSGALYALEPGWIDGKDAGLYRLDAVMADGKMAVKALKIIELDRPTAMAFAPDGALFVTVLGPVKEGGEKTGHLLKITGSL